MQLLFVSDKQLYADFITQRLSEEFGIQNIDQLSTPQEVKDEKKIHSYDFAIVDTGLYDKGGLEVIRFLTTLEVGPKVIALADLSNPNIVAETYKYKVVSYVSNDHDIDGFDKCIKKTFEGDGQFTRKTRKEMRRWVENNKSSYNMVQVSKREREILRYICDEYTSVEIAEKLFISEHTVLTHRKNLLKKVGAKNTVGLVKYAIINEIVTV